MSKIWQHFEKSVDGIVCKTCKQSFKISIRSSTSNLWAHMRRKHNITENQETNAQPKLDKFCMENGERLLIEMIASCNVPMNIVENKAFQKLLKNYPRDQKLPSRKKVNNVMSCRAKEIDEESRKRLEEAIVVGLTLDCWSTPNRKAEYCAITCNIISKSFSKSSFLLDFSELPPERHTSQQLQDHLEEKISFFKIETQKLYSIVADGASNIKKCVQNLGLNYHHCGAHSINIFVKNMMDNNIIAGALMKLRSFCSFLNRSNLANNTLLRFSKRFKEPTTSIHPPVPTRWNSFYLAVCDCLLRLNSVQSTMLAIKKEPFTAEEVYALEIIRKFFEPFFILVEKLCKTDSTLSEFVPGLHSVRTLISKPDFNLEAKGRFFQADLLSCFETFFSQYKDDRALLHHCFVDPRFAYRNNLFNQEKWIRIEKEFIETFKREPAVSEREEINTHSNDLFSLYREEESNTCSLEEEIQQYKICIRKQMKFNGNPLDFWRQKSSEFPLLALIAIQHLVTPSTSVDSERVFSNAGILFGNKRRAKMVGNTARSLLTVAANTRACLSASTSRNWYGRYLTKGDEDMPTLQEEVLDESPNSDDDDMDLVPVLESMAVNEKDSDDDY